MFIEGFVGDVGVIARVAAELQDTVATRAAELLVQARLGAAVAHVHRRRRGGERGLRDLRCYAERRAEPFLRGSTSDAVHTLWILPARTDRCPSRVGTVAQVMSS